MKLLIQRVLNAQVKVENKIFSQIKNGIIIFIGISKTDDHIKIDKLITKILKIKIFSDINENQEKKFSKNIIQANGDIMIISQFTLYGNLKKGTKPNFNSALEPQKAKILYEYFIEELRKKTNLNIQTGKFQTKMEIQYTNDGPVSFIIEN